MLCLALVNTAPTRPKESSIRTISRRRKPNNAPEHRKNAAVLSANDRRPGMKSGNGNSTISAIRRQGVRSIFTCSIPFTIVASVRNIFRSIQRTLPLLTPITPTKSWNSPFVSLSRTACLIGRQAGIFGVTIACSFPLPRFKTGSRRRGKKTYSQIETDIYFDWAFENFSGYIAVDEVYDGPFCILVIVDNREYKRLMSRVLNHEPKSEDIQSLFDSFRKVLDERSLTVKGITTDGSSLYTEPVRAVFSGISHQMCEFHVKKEINKGVLKAVAHVRRELEKTKTKRTKRGRPTTKADKATIRKNERIDEKIGALFKQRYLFVQKNLTVKEHKMLKKITRGLPELRKLREIVDEVYGLYDRRCRRATGLKKLQTLRERLKRFKHLSQLLKKIESPTVDRSLLFLDDKHLPSTSNAVERSNRRFRKMQKTIYRVRTFDHIKQRVAMDMFRDSRLPQRGCTIQSLHNARTG